MSWFNQKINYLKNRYQLLQLQHTNNHYYRDVARVYDYFSQHIFHPELLEFIDHLATLIKPKAQVMDVGAGTGLFGQHLLNKTEHIKFTTIEPSTDMFECLENTLKNTAFNYQGFLNEFIHQIIGHDLVIFQRSIHHCINDTLSLPLLCEHLKRIILPEGFVAIYQQPPWQNPAQAHEYFQNKINLYNLDQAQFEEFWPLYLSMLTEIDKGIERKTFSNLKAETVLEALLEAGFHCHSNHINDQHYFIVQNTDK